MDDYKKIRNNLLFNNPETALTLLWRGNILDEGVEDSCPSLKVSGKIPAKIQ